MDGNKSTVAADTHNAQVQALSEVVARHHLFPRLVEEVVACRKIGVVAPSDMIELDSLVSKVRQHRNLGPNIPVPTRQSGKEGADPELESFMESYITTLTQSQQNLATGFQQADSAFASFLDKISLVQGRGIQASTASVDCGGVSSGSGSKKNCALTDGNDGLKGVLKKRFEGKLEILKNEFTKKRVKGKLPDEALQVLQAWWHANIKKPYPDEDEKRNLCLQSALSMTQVNNFFINQRKRHWSKGDGSKTEDTQIQGAAALGVMNTGMPQGHPTTKLCVAGKRSFAREYKQATAPKRRNVAQRSGSDSEDCESGSVTETESE